MKGDDQVSRLLAMARSVVPDTAAVEFGFETRLLARVRSERSSNLSWLLWSWRLMPMLAAVVLLLGAWSWFAPLNNGSDLQQLAPTFITEQTLASHWTVSAAP